MYLTLPCGQLRDIHVPRSRDGGFKSQLFPQRRRSLTETEDLIRAMIMAGVSTRKMGEVFNRLFGMGLSHTTVSRLGAIAEQEITAWRERALQKRYGVIFLNVVFVSLKRDRVEKEAVYVALAIGEDGRREILGYWIPRGGESAENWREFLQDLRRKGLESAEFIVTDGLAGLKEVIADVFPTIQYQRYVTHMMRRSSTRVRVSDREFILADFKRVYQVIDKEQALE